MKTQRTALYIALIAVLGRLAGYWLYLNENRYVIQSTGTPGVTHELDRKTGRSWLIYGNTKTEQLDPEQKRRANDLETVRLPLRDWEKVTGNAGQSGYGTFGGKIYNGSDWVITRFVVRLRCAEPDGTERWTRDFRVDQEILPLSTQSFSFAVTGDQGSPAMTWSLSDIYGHSEN